MAKITSRASLNVGTELTIDETARTFTLNEAANLVAKDGGNAASLVFKVCRPLDDDHLPGQPLSLNAIDALSGQYYFGVDAGGNYNGWKPASDATRNMLRDGGWREYSSAKRAQPRVRRIRRPGRDQHRARSYYILNASDAPTNFPFADQFNVGVQVYGDAANGDFDKRTYAKTYCREYGKKYKDSVLADTGKDSHRAFLVNFLISNEDDLKIQANDAAMTGAPYDGITVSYYSTNQNRLIGGSQLPFPNYR